jgi:hypothetical protein
VYSLMPKTVLVFLLAIANREPHAVALLASFRHPKGACFHDADFVFTLPALHELVCAFDVSYSLDYPSFRQSLYRGELNVALQKYGYCANVYHSTGAVDTSLYCLSLA